MIIGRGLLARAVTEIDAKDFIFYANGISNSVLHEISPNNFELNEIKEIAHKGQKAVFVYFSTCQVNSVLNYSRPYVEHKISIEEYIRKHFHKYLIVRTSNLVGHNPWNLHTLFNYLDRAISVQEPITINPDLQRNFLDVEHFVKFLEVYLQVYNCNETVEIVNPISYIMNEIVKEFEKHFSKRFVIKKIDNVTNFAVFELNIELSMKLAAECNICMKEYISYLLKKYHPLPPSKHIN